MTDFNKMVVTDNNSIKKIWNNSLLYFDNDLTKVNTYTGEIKEFNTRKFESTEFNLVPHKPKNPNEGTKRLEISFKPHYWFNRDLHNANDLTPIQARETIQRFIKLFNIEHPEHFKIVNLEYGVNFLIDGYGKELISYPCYHQKEEFIRDAYNKYSKKRIGTKYLTIKLYSKGWQFPEYCPENTIRFEVKSRRSSRIKPLGIYHLGDLLKEEPYLEMKKDIIKNAKRVLIIDPDPNYIGLTKREANKLKDYSNSSYWFMAINQNRDNAFNEKKKNYFKYLDKTEHNINRKFVESIENKLNQLFNENGMNYAPH